MKRTLVVAAFLLVASGLWTSHAWSRGGGGGARGGGGAARSPGAGASRGPSGSPGGFGGAGASRSPMSSGSFGGFGGSDRSFGSQSGGGLSGGGFRPPSAQRPDAASSNRPDAGRFGAGQVGGPGARGPGADGFGGSLGRDGSGFNRSGLVHMPGAEAGGLQVGSRPQLGADGAITRGDFRPGGDARPAPGNLRPGAGEAVRPNIPGVGAEGLRPGGAATTLPGLGTSLPGAGAGSRLPGTAMQPGAAAAGSRFSSANVSQRHQDLAGQFDQMHGQWGDGDWHSWTGPNGGQVNHIGYWGPNGYWGHTGVWGPNGGYLGRTTAAGPAGYWSRSWGSWYNGCSPAWGYGRWDYLWNQYPVASAFGATMWGLNAVSYAMGVGTYSNPYYDGQPVNVDGQAVASYDAPITGDPSYETAAAENTDPTTDPLTQAFDQARASFHADQFEQALQQTDQLLKQAPRDAAINEFRSLCLFALGRYRESAATIHAVLAAGPGWDWTTMVSLYSSVDVYTAQLRKLEAAVNADPQAADDRFLLGYHYLTQDHADAAVAMWRQVVQLQPTDKLSADLVQMYAPKSDVPPQPSATATSTAPAPDLDKPAYPLDKLQGDWKAKQGDGEFDLNLGTDDSFKWSFTRDGKPQAVTGAYAVRGNNLVMQPDTGGTMLSMITLQDDHTLQFAPIGDAEKLTFTK